MTLRQRSRKLPRSAKPYVAFIADIVGSRAITGARRRELQRRLEASLAAINRDFAADIAASFLVTIGDEFQGLLRTAAIIPQVLRRLEAELTDVTFRAGFGYGRIETELRPSAIGMDGPVWHAARAAIEEAKQGERLGGVFRGFGEDDLLHDGFARALHQLRSRLTDKQRALLNALLGNETQKAIAQSAGVSKQSVSKQSRAAGVEPYREVELAWRSLLARADDRAGRS